MPLASIDIGSNSIRLFIGDVKDGRILHIRYERAVTRLASGLTEGGLLRKPNTEKTLSVLKGFLEITKAYKVSAIKAVGTSALREAQNAGDFLKRVSAETGLEVEVITGRREAGLTALGVMASLEKKVPPFIVDIGGGSTEWILSDGKKVLSCGSQPVGVVKLHERHIRSDPPSPPEIASMNKELKDAATAVAKEAGGLIHEDTTFIGTAGTATTVAAIDLGLEEYAWQKVHMHEIGIGRLIELRDMLTALPLRERLKTKGLEPGRADLIIPGIHFIISLMQTLGRDRLTVSDHGLLEGALIELSGGAGLVS